VVKRRSKELGAAVRGRELRIEGCAAGQPEDSGLLDRALKFAAGDHCCEVQQRSDGRRDGDSLVRGRFAGCQSGTAHANACARTGVADDRHVDVDGARRQHLPHRPGRPVARHCAVAQRQNRSDDPGERRVERTELIDAAMPAMQPPLSHAARDRPAGHAELGQLPGGDHGLLAASERGRPPLHSFTAHNVTRSVGRLAPRHL